MRAVNRTLLAALVGIALIVPVALIGDALDFGSIAWIVAVVAVAAIASLIDREGFYGPPRQSRGQS